MCYTTLMALRHPRTAAEIIQRCIMAARLWLLQDEESGFHSIWSQLAYQVVASGPHRRLLYKLLEKNQRHGTDKVANCWIYVARQQYPEFDEAYQAIFGDPLQIPSYPQFKKMVKIGWDEVITDSSNWDKFPGCFDVIYRLTFLYDLQQLIDAGTVHNSLTMKDALALHDQQKTKDREEEDRMRQERHMRMLDSNLRQQAKDEVIAEVLQTM